MEEIPARFNDESVVTYKLLKASDPVTRLMMVDFVVSRPEAIESRNSHDQFSTAPQQFAGLLQ